MKKIVLCLVFIVLGLMSHFSQAQFVVESLDGPVTQNEINAFKTWAQGINIPSNWAPSSNQMSYGSEGRKCEALGLMYELTKDKAILDGLIKFADGLLKRRNNPVTGTFEWTGERELIWLPEEVRSGAEQGLIESKILYAAQLILQSPTLWDQTIPTNPNGYGITYRQRALKYVEEMEKTESTYLFKWYVRASDKHLIFPNDPRSDAGTHGGEMPFNQKWMLMFGKMRMAKCYELLGNATMATKYKEVVQANLSLYASQMYPRTYQGHDAYIWYYPTNNQVYTEDIGHAQHGIIGMMNLDLLGGYTSMPDRVKMGNAILYANYRTSDNSWNHNVAGTNPTWYRKIQPGFIFLSRYVPTLYKTIGDDLIKEDVVTDQYDATAYILWAKNARYTGNWTGTCTSTSIVPYTRINGGTWNQTTNAILNTGDKVDFGPQPTSGGSWSWTGPNGFTSTSRQITISNIQSNQAGNYVATHTNSCGAASTSTFTICTPTSIDPYMEVNGGTWDNINAVTVNVGEEAGLGPHPTTGGSWSWTGPNGFTSTNRWFKITNIQANQGGNYVATYINDCGAKSTSTLTVNVTTPNTPPTVSITSPSNNASYTAPANFTIAASASDAEGSVTKVEFFQGTTKLGEDAVSPYSFSVADLAAGTYTLTARATDNAGAATTSSAITVTVNAVSTCQPASASADDGNLATNVLDGDLTTRWSASGDGQWIQFCLDAEKNINGVQIAFFSGDSRTSTFDILLSLNGTSWTTAASGLISSGTSLALENFTFTAATAKYVRIVGHGNSSNAWNSYTEVKINEVITSGVVTVYKNCNYSTTGYAISLPVGNYTTAQLLAQGVADNDISSVQVSSSYEIVLYDADNFQGTPLVLSADISCLTGNSFNDLASSVIVRVATTNNAPAVSITSPSNNATYTAPASFTVTATASDGDGSVAKVELYRGTTRLDEELTSPYTFAISGLAAGTYTFTARATDDKGAVTTSSVITVTVTAPQNQLPSVSITSPSNNASYTAPADFTITASASDADGSVTKVEFYRGTTKLGEDAVSPYSFSVTGLAAGTYSLTVRATDDLGAVTTSAAISITVQANTNTCSGIAQYVENGGYAEGSKVQNSGSQYLCKPYPYSGWCNGAAWAYAPGTGSYWQDAWTLVGACSAAKMTMTNDNIFSISPNPSSQVVVLQFDVLAAVADVKVVDAYGKVVKEVKSFQSGEAMNISGLSNGMYIIQINTPSESVTRSIVKN